MKSFDSKIALALSAALALAGCDGPGAEDAGTDSGPTGTDSGVDAGPMDAGPEDAGPEDAGLEDAGLEDTGAGDAGPIGGGATTSTQIQAARDAVDGVVTLPIDDAIVTYTKPATGDDVAGFFIQAEPTGPALFVRVDPALLSPMPAAGSVVSFQIDEMMTLQGRREATMVSSFTEASTGNDVSFLVQDVSAATDLVTALDDYESELITLSGTLTADFGFAGVAHGGAAIDTAGITGSPDLVVRLPSALRASLELVSGCEVSLTGPMWRFTTRAQPSAYRDTELTITSCPAPRVLSAAAPSLTEAVVSFDRSIDMASITDAATQFTITDSGAGALAVSAAVVSGTTVTLTTATQTPGEIYTVTVAATVTDTLGVGVDAAANTATFSGYETPAGVRINEVNANITGGCDLVELRVVSGGTMAGYTLTERGSAVVTFPMGFSVATNDLIVVHFDGNDGACNGGTAGAPPADETTSASEVPTATVSTNYDTAFDFYATDTGITSTDNVIGVEDALGVIQDVVFISDAPTGTSAGSTESAAAAVAAAMEWEMVGGGVPAGGFVDGDFNAHAVQDSNATGTDATGETIQRNDDADNNDRDDWVQAAQSWAALNAGQTAL